MRQSPPQFIQDLALDDPDWQQLCQTLKTSTTLATTVLSAWKMGLWLAKAIAEQQLQERADAPVAWSNCSTCKTQLVRGAFRS